MTPPKLTKERIDYYRRSAKLHPLAVTIYKDELLALLDAAEELERIHSTPFAGYIRTAVLEKAAQVAECPYGDEVAVIGREEPRAVGQKIADAIRALKKEKP